MQTWGQMKPRENRSERLQGDLFRMELKQMIDRRHPMVRLAEAMDWEAFEKQLESSWHPETGRPGVNTRLMVSLQYLKYTHNLSDEEVLALWVENPYWQYLSGMNYFEHEPPVDASSLCRWRKRLAEGGAEALLEQTLAAGLKLRVIQPRHLEKVNVDTTVQEKHVRFPTDGRLYNRARETLVRLAKKRGIELRQSYERVGPRELHQQSRYAHARQFKRAKRSTRKLKTYLRRVIRDIERKMGQGDEEMLRALRLAKRIESQQRKDKGKVYSVHAPEVECISKGKAHKRYEFGVKVSVGVSSRGGWLMSAGSHPGNPYDGHTLKSTLDRIPEWLAEKVKEVFVDGGYRGHGYEGEIEVHVDQKKRGKISKRTWRWLKRRSAVEPTIGHLKERRRLNRNRLKGSEGDHLNAVLSAAAMNFAKLLSQVAQLWRQIREMLKRLMSPLPTDTPRTITYSPLFQ